MSTSEKTISNLIRSQFPSVISYKEHKQNIKLQNHSKINWEVLTQHHMDKSTMNKS